MTQGSLALNAGPSSDTFAEALARVLAGVDAILPCTTPSIPDCAKIIGSADVTESDGTHHSDVPFASELVEGGPGLGVLRISLESGDLDGLPGDFTAGDDNYDTTIDVTDGMIDVRFRFTGGPPP
jgi:hypothetical protein